MKGNQLTELQETVFKDYLLSSLVYEGVTPLEIQVNDNPLSCCSLAWMYLEGKRYGDAYKSQVSGAYCQISVPNEYLLWDMTCDNFILCQTEDGLENFVAECEATGPEPLPQTTPGL